MVPILDGDSEIGAHVRNNVCYLTCSGQSIISRAIIIGIFVLRKLLLSIMRAQLILSYHLLLVPRTVSNTLISLISTMVTSHFLLFQYPEQSCTRKIFSIYITFLSLYLPLIFQCLYLSLIHFCSISLHLSLCLSNFSIILISFCCCCRNDGHYGKNFSLYLFLSQYIVLLIGLL